MSVKNLKSKNLATRYTVDVLLDADASDRYARAAQKVEHAKKAVDAAKAREPEMLSRPAVAKAEGDLADAETELAAAAEAAQQHLMSFEFESIGATAWERMVAEHPPTAEQLADPTLATGDKGDKPPAWNVATFPVSAIAASLRTITEGDGQPQPAFDDDQDVNSREADIVALKDDVSDRVWQMLTSGAILANRGTARVPLALSGSARTRSGAAK